MAEEKKCSSRVMSGGLMVPDDQVRRVGVDAQGDSRW